MITQVIRTRLWMWRSDNEDQFIAKMYFCTVRNRIKTRVCTSCVLHLCPLCSSLLFRADNLSHVLVTKNTGPAITSYKSCSGLLLGRWELRIGYCGICWVSKEELTMNVCRNIATPSSHGLMVERRGGCKGSFSGIDVCLSVWWRETERRRDGSSYHLYLIWSCWHIPARWLISINLLNKYQYYTYLEFKN